MLRELLETLRQVFYLLKRILYVLLTAFLASDLSVAHSYISIGLALVVLWAVLLFFDPVIDILLRVSIIALIVLVSLGYCRDPNIFYGVCTCSVTAGKLTFHAIADVIHRLLAGPQRPEITESYLLMILTRPSPAT
jgi:hypothetical protein